MRKTYAMEKEKKKKTALQRVQGAIVSCCFLLGAIMLVIGIQQAETKKEGNIYSNPNYRVAPGTEQAPASSPEGNPVEVLIILKQGLFPSGGTAAFFNRQHPQHDFTMFAWGMIMIAIGLVSIVADKGNDGKIQLWWAWVGLILSGLALIFFL